MWHDGYWYDYEELCLFFLCVEFVSIQLCTHGSSIHSCTYESQLVQVTGVTDRTWINAIQLYTGLEATIANIIGNRLGFQRYSTGISYHHVPILRKFTNHHHINTCEQPVRFLFLVRFCMVLCTGAVFKNIVVPVRRFTERVSVVCWVMGFTFCWHFGGSTEPPVRVKRKHV
jgi:hypothetical protein